MYGMLCIYGMYRFCGRENVLYVVKYMVCSVLCRTWRMSCFRVRCYRAKGKRQKGKKRYVVYVWYEVYVWYR